MYCVKACSDPGKQSIMSEITQIKNDTTAISHSSNRNEKRWKIHKSEIGLFLLCQHRLAFAKLTALRKMATPIPSFGAPGRVQRG